MRFFNEATALPGLRPLGHVLEQFMIVWHRNSLKLSFSASSRSLVFSSRESSTQRYACMRTAGPKYLSDAHLRVNFLRTANHRMVTDVLPSAFALIDDQRKLRWKSSSHQPASMHVERRALCPLKKAGS